MWPNAPTVSNRKPGWYSISEVNAAQIFWTKTYDSSFMQRYSQNKLLADQRLYQINPIDDSNIEFIAAILNSTIFSLFIELGGRVNLGDGALDTTVDEVKDHILTINPSKISKSQKSNIIAAFNKIIDREIGSINDESKKRDRKMLDSRVLSSMGLDPKKYLDPLYSGLIELVTDRLSLPKMRKKVAKAKIDYSIQQIKEQVEKEILPDGLQRFPEAFTDKIQKKNLSEISVPARPLRIGSHFFGKYEILDDNDKKVYEADGIDMAVYIICSYKPDEYILQIPKSPKAIMKAVQNYQIYIKELYLKLANRALSASTDYKIAERLALEILRENGYMGNFDLD